MREEREITKHLATVVDIQSAKFQEAVKECDSARGELPLTAEYLRLMEKVVWESLYLEPTTRSAFLVPCSYGQQIYSDYSFDQAFAQMPPGLKFKVEWDAVAHFTEMDDYKNCSVNMTNFRITAIPDTDE